MFAISSGFICISNNISAISEYLIYGKYGILAREESYYKEVLEIINKIIK